MSQPCQPAVQYIAHCVVNTIDNGDEGITNPSSWPHSASLGVRYKVHDRQFPQVKHEPSIEYFDNVAGLAHWLEEKRAWIRGTDFDFSMDYSVYAWDLGPVLKYSKSM